MIHNYIKEIEDLRYLHNVYLDNFKKNKTIEVLAVLQLFSCVVITLGAWSSELLTPSGVALGPKNVKC